MSSDVSPAAVIAALGADGWLDSLTPAERAVLPWMLRDVWLRPEQCIPAGPWRSYGFDGGRGFGKSICIGAEIDRRVRAGEERKIALMAPTEARVEEVQLQTLHDVAPPWDRPERYKGGLRWSNGTVALAFTPEAPGRTRSENVSLTWLCEIVDWNPHTAVEAFQNITTATRIGRAQFIWDSTNKGRNEVLESIRDMHARNPDVHVIIGGTTFDNPLLSDTYLREEWSKYAGVRRDEELLGMHFAEAAAALFKQLWLNRSRVVSADVPPLEQEIVSIDPAQSTNPGSDETGLVKGGRARDGHVYVQVDRTGRYSPEEWGDIAVSYCRRGGNISIERNHIGEHGTYVLRSRAMTTLGPEMQVRVLAKAEPWPARDDRCIFVREQWSRESKGTRADGPAAETEAGRVHLVGEFAQLETQLVTYVPGSGRSPNNYDAFAYLVTELRGLAMAPKANGNRDVQVAAEVQRRLTSALASAGADAVPTYRPPARVAARARGRMGI